MITTKINIKMHLAEYLNAKYFEYIDPNKPQLGGYVRIPDKLDLYHLIWNLMEKRPVNCCRDEGNVTLALPDRRDGKDPVTYNYLGIRSMEIIEKRVEVLFHAEYRAMFDENKHRLGITFLETAHEFVNKYRIESISTDALYKDYYRFRNNILRRTKTKRAYTFNK